MCRMTWVPAGAQLADALGLPGFGSAGECPGGFLGTVQVVDVHDAAGCCARWGHQEPGTFHWVLTDPQPLPAPIPGLVLGPGRLWLYRVPDHVLAAVR